MFRLKDILGLCLLSSFCFAAEDGNAQIIQYSSKKKGDTGYEYGFETGNGIKRQETGDAIPSIHDASNNAAIVKGCYSYPGPDGVIYTVRYVADEAGFHPKMDHLNIPPCTPWVPGEPVDNDHYKKGQKGQLGLRDNALKIAAPKMRLYYPLPAPTTTPIISTQKPLPSEDDKYIVSLEVRNADTKELVPNLSRMAVLDALPQVDTVDKSITQLI